MSSYNICYSQGGKRGGGAQRGGLLIRRQQSKDCTAEQENLSRMRAKIRAKVVIRGAGGLFSPVSGVSLT